MTKRDLYAEIVEGFNVLSHLRDGKTNLCSVPASIAGLAKEPTRARKSKALGGDLDVSADEEKVGKFFLRKIILG